MTKTGPQPGDLLVVKLPHHDPQGREQEGLRPVLFIADPALLGTPRFPMLLVAPLTSQMGAWTDAAPKLYPRLKQGTAGLNLTSVVLLDNLRSIDATRVVRRLGKVSKSEFKQVQEALQSLCQA